MQFQPKTEAEIAEANLWPEGEYGFEILDEVTMGTKTYYTMDTKSKKTDADMIQLVVKVYDNEGQFRTIIDYLIASMEFKLRHAAAACGLLPQYETGSLTANDFKGKQGFLKLRIGKAQGDYPAKNEVKDYIAPDSETVSHAPPPGHPAATAPIEDDIQF